MFEEEQRETSTQYAALERHRQQNLFQLKYYFSYESYFLQNNKFSRVITFHTNAQSSVYANSNTTSIREVAGTVSDFFSFLCLCVNILYFVVIQFYMKISTGPNIAVFKVYKNFIYLERVFVTAWTKFKF